MSHKYGRILGALSLLLFLYGAATVYWTSQEISLIGDESTYFDDLGYWKTKDYSRIKFHPPLIHLLGTVTKNFFSTDRYEHARLVFVLFYILAGLAGLAFFYFKVGAWSSFIFSALFGLCPNIKAMAPLIEVDVIPACLTGLVALSLWWMKESGRFIPVYFLAVGLVGGLAIVGKFSNFFYFPFIFLICVLEYKKLKIIRALGLVAAGVALAFLIVYQFRPLQILHFWDVLVIHSNYNKGGHATVFMGQFIPRGVWYYYLVLIFAKTPVVILLAYAVMAVLVFKDWRKNKNIIWCFILPTLALLLALSVLRVQIGYRYFMPGIILLLLACSIVIGRWIQENKDRRTRGLIALLVAVLLVVDWKTFRGSLYLSFFSALSKNPSRNFVDSNGDWGQRLPDRILKRFPDYKPFESFSKLVLSTLPPDPVTFYIGTSALSGLWGPSEALILRGVPVQKYYGGFEFFEMTINDLFNLMFKVPAPLEVNNEILRKISEPVDLNPSCAVDVGVLHEGENRLPWTKGRVLILPLDKKNFQLKVEKGEPLATKAWIPFETFPAENPVVQVNGIALYMIQKCAL